MAQTTRTDGRHAWREWYEFRAEARRNAMDEEEFSSIQRDKFDLDTAGIGEGGNPETYTIEPYGDDQEAVDYRDVDPRF